MRITSGTADGELSRPSRPAGQLFDEINATGSLDPGAVRSWMGATTTTVLTTRIPTAIRTQTILANAITESVRETHAARIETRSRG